MADVTPGLQTSEYQLTNRASWIGIALMVLGVLVEVADALVQALAPIAAQLPDVKWIGAILLVAGTIVKVGAVVGYQKSRALVKASASAAKSTGLALLLAIGVAFAPGLARADDAPSLGTCFDKGNQICLRPIVGFSGAAYDFSQHQVVRSFEVSGLYELTIFPGKLGVAAGGGFQSGTVQGVAVTALVTLPYSLALGVSELIVGGTASTSLTAGTVIRF